MGFSKWVKIGMKNPFDINICQKLLIKAFQLFPSEDVLIFSCGNPHFALIVAKLNPDARIYIVDTDIRSVHLAEEQKDATHIFNAQAILADTPQDLKDLRFATVLLSPPIHIGKDRIFEMIEDSAHLLKPNGRLYFSAKTNKGAKTYSLRMRQVLGNSTLLKKGSGVRVVLSLKDQRTDSRLKRLPSDRYHNRVRETIRERQYTFVTTCGIFSRERIDSGTKLLLEAVQIKPGDVILDLGCGYGAIGITAAREASQGKVYMLDSDIRAVKFANKNIKINEITNAQALIGDGFESLKNEKFNLIISNPPSHRGAGTALQFVAGSYKALGKKGRLYLVAVRPQLYRKRMINTFGNACVVEENGDYTVLMSEAGR